MQGESSQPDQAGQKASNKRHRNVSRPPHLGRRLPAAEPLVSPANARSRVALGGRKSVSTGRQFSSATTPCSSAPRWRHPQAQHESDSSIPYTTNISHSVSPSKTPIKTENRDKSPGSEVDLNNAGQVGRPDDIPVSPVLSRTFCSRIFIISAWLNLWAERFQAQQQYAAALTRAIRFPLQAQDTDNS